ncbi:MAG: translation initiation factor IF-2 [Candidatus Nealsonbacteria bacterium CG08_land_8_20_14_0_20_43_11]|uniref:Translation initiation factor IF-2 n=1 Tax=Candidatus Nealsonbacteria bacterium CG08_land_8_20_14_0_20_43_11 TaxID=1974706 RepID=A0A2M6T115_9BACT|nr:MAG: translation initiation factor IF-2 [Candidatus Nealsonbacteria bacterium CG08_land_8_20_14_0_20_43_11]
MANNEQQLNQDVAPKGERRPRPPIVVVMGHIDHGKTTLLDNIRKSHVAEKESGGITQHVGAYEIEHHAKKIIFIDTPGHEAFSAMRSRSAKVADIAILVVAADEGVKAQTKEAISHIKNSGIDLIVAINKIDKPGADPEQVKRELIKEEILVESMAGKIPSVNVSALTGEGVANLLEMILLVAEVQGITADYNQPAQGVVIEAFMDSQRGATATLLVKEGILRKGDVIGTASGFGKLMNLLNFQGKSIEQALPSMPAIVFGLEKIPRIGEEFKVFSCLELAENCLKKVEEKIFLPATAEGVEKTVNLVVKADFLGSVEALKEVLKQLPQEKVTLNILKAEVGDVNESDVKLAKENNAKIFAFRVKTSPPIKNLAEREKVRIINCEIIYEIVEDVHKLMEKSVAPEIVRVDLGKLKVLMVFLIDKNRQIVGGKVTEGEVKRGAVFEIWRNEELIGQAKIVNLQRNKKDADKVAKSEECGLLCEGDKKIEADDILVFYTEERHKAEL